MGLYVGGLSLRALGGLGARMFVTCLQHFVCNIFSSFCHVFLALSHGHVVGKCQIGFTRFVTVSGLIGFRLHAVCSLLVCLTFLGVGSRKFLPFDYVGINFGCQRHECLYWVHEVCGSFTSIFGGYLANDVKPHEIFSFVPRS